MFINDVGNALINTTNDNSSGSKLQVNGTVTIGNYTVATLPLSPAGYPHAMVTDSLTALSVLGVGITPTGGGANVMPVYYNGSAWVSY